MFCAISFNQASGNSSYVAFLIGTHCWIMSVKIAVEEIVIVIALCERF